MRWLVSVMGISGSAVLLQVAFPVRTHGKASGVAVVDAVVATPGQVDVRPYGIDGV